MNERYKSSPRFLFCHDNSHYPLAVVFFSGLGSTIERQHVQEYRSFCYHNNVSFLALDFTAHAYIYQKSEEADFGMSHRLEDALNLLQSTLQDKPFITLGFSMGGKLALEVAHTLKSQTQELIELAPAIELGQYRWYDNLKSMVHKKLHLLEENNQKGKTLENLYVFARLLEAVKPHLLLHKPVSFKGDIHLIHGTEDKHVPYQNSQLFQNTFAPQAHLSILEGETHHFLKPQSRRNVLNVLSQKIKMAKER